jgi:DNA-directed RNA polymerase subunit RPC12/RpoP
MEVSVSLPLDPDQYLRRECSQCEREFKWHHGPTDGAPEPKETPSVYYCPYCGEPAGLDQWYTKDQIETIRAAALAEVLPKLQTELKGALSPLNRSGFIKADVTSRQPLPPPPLIEAADMVAVASPCHPYEPVKIADSWDEPIHCLVCGSRYTV